MGGRTHGARATGSLIFGTLGVLRVQGFWTDIVEILAYNFDKNTSKALSWRGFSGHSADPNVVFLIYFTQPYDTDALYESDGQV